MPDHGTELGVDLNELYRTAHFLSTVHEDFVLAAEALNANQPPPNAGPWTSVMDPWKELRQTLTDLLNANAQAIIDTSDTLNAIAQQYAAADQAAAASFTALAQNDTSEQGWSS
ncbi:MAG TPA: hypothetical protein VJ914_06055 [Pseudonocardiaceae bacterium]|nr:hypothetical protein [Pseudonocardiaceae bacterium]